MHQSYGRILFVLAGIALAVYFAWKIAQRIDAFFYPWANERPGHVVLTGNWLGTFAPSSADSRAMLVELHRWREDRAHPCADCQIIEGVARVCDADGAVVTYRMSGVPRDRLAKRIRLRISPQSYQGMIDHELVTADGEWDGATLRLNLQSKGASTPLQTEMTRGVEASWKEQCEALMH